MAYYARGSIARYAWGPESPFWKKPLLLHPTVKILPTFELFLSGDPYFLCGEGYEKSLPKRFPSCAKPFLKER